MHYAGRDAVEVNVGEYKLPCLILSVNLTFQFIIISYFLYIFDD